MGIVRSVDAPEPALTSEGILTIEERGALHRKELEAHRHVRQARALVHLVLADGSEPGEFGNGEHLHVDALRVASALLENACRSFADVVSRLENMQEALGLSLGWPLPDRALGEVMVSTDCLVLDELDGVPVDFVRDMIVRALWFVRRCKTVCTVAMPDQHLELCSAARLLDALVLMFDRGV